MEKTGIIDVGGGLRGVYAAGVLDCCMDAGVQFDLGIGVSAGSANIASYLAGQKKRNYQFYTEYPFRREYMSLRNFLVRRSYLDLDYIYSTLSNADGENPLNYQAIADNPADFLIVATDAQTGCPKYFTKEDLHQDDYSVFKASCAIPAVCHPYAVCGTDYFDGGLSDPVPVEEALRQGCSRIVLLLSKRRDAVSTSAADDFLADRIQKKYPAAAEKLRCRARLYNQGIARAKELEAEGTLLIVAPDDTCGVSTLTKNRDSLKKLYEKGYQDAAQIPEFLYYTSSCLA